MSTVERTPITPDNQYGEPTLIKVGTATEIGIWRSMYNGERQVTTGFRGPRTNGFWKMGVKSFNKEVSTAFVYQSLGWTVTDDDEEADEPAAIEAPKRARRGTAV